jgi:thiamine pyrophosphate-dependent acetolactate synthase large subunit-like protein
MSDARPARRPHKATLLPKIDESLQTVDRSQVLSLSGGEALWRTARVEKPAFVSGVVGGKFASFLHALNNDKTTPYIGTRHEAAAGFMATAAFAGTGRVAMTIAEAGSGGSNLLPALAGAKANRLAMVAITSNTPQSVNYPHRGMFMEMDNANIFAPVTKWNAVVHDGRRLPELVHTAFRQALSGVPGPVHLDIPLDVLSGTFEYAVEALDRSPEHYRPSVRPTADVGQIASAARLLKSAERLLVVAGGGVVSSNATDLVRQLVSRLGAVATSTQMGLGVIPSNDPHFIGHGGVVGGPVVTRAFAEADVILAIGCRFSTWLWDDKGSLARNAKLIHLDIDPAVIGATAAVEVGLVGDAKSSLEALLKALGPAHTSLPASDWRTSCAADYTEYRRSLQNLRATSTIMHPAELTHALAAALPVDALVTYDGGHGTFWSNDILPALHPRSRFHEPGMTQLGFGLPYALALQICNPGRPVLNITGDGAFGFTIQELDTARRYGLPVINVIHNNEAWGVIGASQQRLNFSLGVELKGTDYAAIGHGFGCHAERIDRPQDVAPALQRALASGLPAVLDCRVTFEKHPCFGAFGKMGQYGVSGNGYLAD